MLNKVKVWIEGNPVILKIVRMMYDNTFLRYKSRRRKENFKNYNSEILIKLHLAFQELDITYWLDFGTLLGAIREKNFISHDLDIDIGVLDTLDNKLRDKIHLALIKYGFSKKYYFVYNNRIREETYSYKGVSIDIFYYEKNNSLVTTYYFLPEKGKSREKTISDRGGLIPIEAKFPFTGVREDIFLGIKTFYPENTIEYIVARYGKNYKNKIIEWDNMTSPKNIKILYGNMGHYCTA